MKPTWFDPQNTPKDALLLNNVIRKKLEAYDNWDYPPEMTRQRRNEGKGAFPVQPLSPNAETLVIEGLGLRIFKPQGQARGAYLHIHGGGWVLGTVDMADPRLEALAQHTGLIVVSVDYRLAPEFPFPCANDDCVKAALWLVSEGKKLWGVDKFYIGGESAGAHLSVCTLLTLRDTYNLTPFYGANLHAGCYDLGLTPSARNFKETKLILSRNDIEQFVRHYLVKGGDVNDPAVSPLYADLRGLPPALFTVGTMDALLDDSLFMYGRWLAAGNKAELEVYTGGCHVFIGFPGSLAEEANARIYAFLKGI